MKNNGKGLLALSPAFVLMAVFLSSVLLSGDFYAVPISVAFVAAAVYGLLIMKGKSIHERVEVFSSGASDHGIMYMIWIFVMAGIFASAAKSMGAVDATVQLTLMAVPSRFLPAGIFLAACFISMAIGTSVGTVVALAPVVTGLAQQTGSNVSWMVAIVVGGAFFGDNLSFISDTTIAATQSQGCAMSDKFKTNILIVLPAALISLIVYTVGGSSVAQVSVPESVSWWLAIPYLLVIVMAVSGINVLIVMLTGIAVTFLMGMCCGTALLDMLKASADGIQGMCELILITMLAGGLMNIIRNAGGFEWLIQVLTRRISGRRGAEFVIAALTALTNLCTANNTVAIITVGGIAKDISTRFGIAPRKTASIMDTSSCFVQGLIPYGIQLMMAGGLAAVSPVSIVGYLYYPMLIGTMVVLTILFQYPEYDAPRA